MLHHPSRYRRAGFGLASVGAGLALLVGVLPTSAGADGSEKEEVEGNPKCVDLGYANGFKIEAGGEFPEEGTYEAGDPGTETEGDAAGFAASISYTSEDPIGLDFETNMAVDAVLVKAGPGGFLYTYDLVMAGSGLGSPKDSISHITFCWDDGDTPPDNGTTTTVPDEGDEDGGGHEEDEGEDGDAGPGRAPGAKGVTAEPGFTG